MCMTAGRAKGNGLVNAITLMATSSQGLGGLSNSQWVYASASVSAQCKQDAIHSSSRSQEVVLTTSAVHWSPDPCKCLGVVMLPWVLEGAQYIEDATVVVDDTEHVPGC
jgi:hypothetical protein